MCGRQERLGWGAAVVDARAAETVALEQHDTLPFLRPVGCKRHAALSAPDHDRVHPFHVLLSPGAVVQESRSGALPRNSAACCSSLATTAVHPVCWLAPSPLPLSPSKYSKNNVFPGHPGTG